MVKRWRLSLSRKEFGDSEPLGLLLTLLNELVLASLWHKEERKLITQIPKVINQKQSFHVSLKKRTMKRLEGNILLNTKTIHIRLKMTERLVEAMEEG